MRKISKLIFCCLLIVSLPACAKTFVTNQQLRFVDRTLSCAKNANQQILEEREFLLTLQKFPSLRHVHAATLQKIAHQYDLADLDFSKAASWQKLLKRVDVVPNSLLIAQAICESNWGRSRFAKAGNNYFGEHCFKEGCGIVPKKRAKASLMEVKKFQTMQQSVNSYLHNLNTHGRYAHLRNLRLGMRAKGEVLDSMQLATALSGYSQNQNYVQTIQSIIQNYHLSQYDV